MTPPRFFVIEHPKEKKHKCTVSLLKGREDLTFLSVEEAESASWNDALLLDPSVDTLLTTRDAGKPLILVDASWRWAERVVRKMACSRRRLPPFETAYPRTSKLFRDPPGGLASAEALFVAALVMGRYDESFLDGYRWKVQFLEVNGDVISRIRPPR
ncbi:MAG: ribosome biogenesis domain-containing protein [Planctomycetota bacterium]|jgi:pre-rRNA-processing protein TSR3